MTAHSKDEGLKVEVERLAGINRQLVEEYNTLLVELVRRDNKTKELSAALLSSSSAERGMREALENLQKHVANYIRCSTNPGTLSPYVEDNGLRGKSPWRELLAAESTARAALSARAGEGDEQARPSGSASISTDTKGTTK